MTQKIMGGEKPIFVLGINDGHLATASLLKDGQIVACVSEERFTKTKNQAGIPTQAIRYCLKSAKIVSTQVDLVVFGGKTMPPTTYNVTMKKNLYTQIYSILKPLLSFTRYSSIYLPFLWKVEEYVYQSISSLLSKGIIETRKQRLLKDFAFDPKKILFLDHHLTHAHSVLWSSGLAKNSPLLIFTCDGEGDGLSATVNIYQKGKLKTISRTSMTNSLGNLYRSVTQYLGMKPLEHEYKVMGLAAYVADKKAEELYQKIKGLIWVDEHSLQIRTTVNSQLFKMGYLNQYFAGYRFDYVAYATQKLTEEVLLAWVTAAIKKTRISKVLLSGGVFMNVKANQKISEINNLKKIFIMPSCSDESNAIGAAYWGYFNSTGKIPFGLSSLYLGMRYEDREILATLKTTKHIKIKEPVNLERDIAKLLAKGEIVARFTGQMEWGARALGNRSILADASRLQVVEVINKMIKSRDFWMPFAPVIMQEHATKYLLNPKAIEAPYMIITFDTTPTGQKHLAAAVHQYDKSARPQVIDKNTNPGYYKILKEFAKITNRYGLLNTSFNLHGEPIVADPFDAMRVFTKSGLKFLAIGPYLVEKLKQ